MYVFIHRYRIKWQSLDMKTKISDLHKDVTEKYEND